MTDGRIGALLEDLASTDGPPSAINIERAITDGRRSVRTRRIMASAVAAIALIAVAGGITVATGSVATPPVHPGTTTSTPPGPAITPPADVAHRLAVWRVDTNTIRTVTGATVALTPAPGLIARSVVQVPAGWVFDAAGAGGRMLYFQPTGHAAITVGPITGTFEVNPDGTAIIATGLVTPGTPASALPHMVAEIALPSLTVVRQVHVGGTAQLTLVRVSGSLVLLRGQNGGTAGAPGSVWDLRTGALTDLSATDRVWPWSITPDGQVLGVNFSARNGGGQTCVYLVPMADATTSHPAHCFDANGPTWGSMSPDGVWALLNVAGGTSTVLSIDTASHVAAGIWDPGSGENTESSPELAFWDTADSFVATTDHGYARCAATGLCDDATLPAGLGFDGRFIQYAGG